VIILGGPWVGKFRRNSREPTCPSRSILKRPVVTFCGVCDLRPTIPHTIIIGVPFYINITNDISLQFPLPARALHLPTADLHVGMLASSL